ncbi:hypothetical protein M514_08051, partial [Trichuris suis]
CIAKLDKLADSVTFVPFVPSI